MDQVGSNTDIVAVAVEGDAAIVDMNAPTGGSGSVQEISVRGRCFDFTAVELHGIDTDAATGAEGQLIRDEHAATVEVEIGGRTTLAELQDIGSRVNQPAVVDVQRGRGAGGSADSDFIGYGCVAPGVLQRPSAVHVHCSCRELNLVLGAHRPGDVQDPRAGGVSDVVQCGGG